MEVRIDQRRQRRRRLDSRIELDAQLAQERQVRPEAGRDDDAVDVELERLAAQHALRPERRQLFGAMRSTAKGVSMLSLPSSIACLAARPSAPRSGS